MKKDKVINRQKSNSIDIDKTFTYSILPKLLQEYKKDYIIPAVKPLLSPQADLADINIVAKGIIDIIVKKRQRLYLLATNKNFNIKEFFDFSFKYTRMLLYFIKERAFLDPIVSFWFGYHRKRHNNKGIQYLLENLLEGVFTYKKDLKAPSKIIELIYELDLEGQRIVSETIKELQNQKKDSGRKHKGGSLALYSNKDFFERLPCEHYTTPLKNKRIFKEAELTPQDEAMLVLGKYDMPDNLIVKVLNLEMSKEGVRKKIAKLWKDPKVQQAVENYSSRTRDELSAHEEGKTGKVTTQEIEHGNFYEQVLSFKGKNYKSVFR